jgi:hypothetical protein
VRLVLQTLLVGPAEGKLNPHIDHQHWEQTPVHVNPLHILSNHPMDGYVKWVIIIRLKEQLHEAALPRSFIMSMAHGFVPVGHEVQ